MKYFIQGCIFTDDEIEAESIDEALMKIKSKYKNIHLMKIESGDISGHVLGYCKGCNKMIISEFHTFFNDGDDFICYKCLKLRRNNG